MLLFYASSGQKRTTEGKIISLLWRFSAGIGTLLLVVLHINELLRFLDDLRLQIGGQRLIAGEFKYKAAASLRELAQIGGEIMHLTDRHVGFQRLLTILGRMHAQHAAAPLCHLTHDVPQHIARNSSHQVA